MLPDDAPCTRRQRSYWTTCKCSPCRTLRLRRNKMYYVGHRRTVPQEVAWAALAEKFEQGWTARAVGSATGLDRPGEVNGRLYFSRHLTAWKRGGTVLIGPEVAVVVVNMGVPTEGQVGATFARRKLRALAAIGHGLQTIADETGIAFSTLAMIRNTNERLSARNALAIGEAYDRLHLVVGGDEQAARMAREKGWPPPLAWDAIDDPDEQPSGVGHQPRYRNDNRDTTEYDPVVVDRILSGEWEIPCTPAEKTEVGAKWVASGGSTYRLEQLTGWRLSRYYKKGAA